MTSKTDHKYPIRDIFQAFGEDYLKSHPATSEQVSVARLISECKTGKLGYNVSVCPDCGTISVNACSCNNRNCPNCQTPQEQKWVLERSSETIDGITYYHAIFTVPFELWWTGVGVISAPFPIVPTVL